MGIGSIQRPYHKYQKMGILSPDFIKECFPLGFEEICFHFHERQGTIF